MAVFRITFKYTYASGIKKGMNVEVVTDRCFTGSNPVGSSKYDPEIIDAFVSKYGLDRLKWKFCLRQDKVEVVKLCD